MAIVYIYNCGAWRYPDRTADNGCTHLHDYLLATAYFTISWTSSGHLAVAIDTRHLVATFRVIHKFTVRAVARAGSLAKCSCLHMFTYSPQPES